MPNFFPPKPVYPKKYDSDETLFLVYNTSETVTTEENSAWSSEISIKPVKSFRPEIWADSGFATIDGELFYYDEVEKNHPVGSGLSLGRIELDENGSVVSVPVIDGGTGFQYPTVKVTSQKGSGAELEAVTVNGSITEFIVLQGGSGYKLDDMSITFEGKVTKFKRCCRNLGGKKTKNNPVGTEVRGFVIAEHHNQLAGAIINAENFIGVNFDPDQQTLDWRIRNLESLPIIFDDFTCPDVVFDFYIVSANSLGTTAQYNISVQGNFTNYRLDFGDGQFTSESTSGTHFYAIGTNIDPVLTLGNEKCQMVLTPVSRDSSRDPSPDPGVTNFDLTIPEIPDVFNLTIPNIPTVEPPVIPPIVFPCVDIGPIGPIDIPSIIVVEPEIPSIIEFGPIPEINPNIEFGPIPEINPLIEFGEVPVITPFIEFGPIPEINPIIEFGPIPEIIVDVQICLPTLIEFGPIPEITPVIEFGPIPEIVPEISVDVQICISPIDIPDTIEFGKVPNIPVLIDFGKAPIIPANVNFGNAPIIPLVVDFGPAPDIKVTITLSPIEIPTQITFGPIPTLIEFAPAPKITFGPIPLVTQITFSPIPLITQINFSPTPCCIPSTISFAPFDCCIPSKIEVGDCNVNVNVQICISPIEIPTLIEFGPAPVIETLIEFAPAPKIKFDPAPTIPNIKFNPAPDIKFSPAPTVPDIKFGPAPNVPVKWGTPPSIQLSPIATDVNVNVQICLSPVEVPTLIEFAPAPKIKFDPAPTIPDIKFDAPPDVPVKWGTPPSIQLSPIATDVNVNVQICLSPVEVPTLVEFAPAPKIKFDPAPTIPAIKFDAPPDVPVKWGTPPSIQLSPIATDVNVNVQICLSPVDVPTLIEFAPAPKINFGDLPTFPTVKFDDPPGIPVKWGSPPSVECKVRVVCDESEGGSQSTSYMKSLNDPNNESIEISVGELNIPTQILVVFPEVPDIKLVHEIPEVIKVEIPEIPDIKIIAPSNLPKEIKIVSDIPESISVELLATNVPKSIEVDFKNLPRTISIEAPASLPDIKIDASSIPEKIQVVGIPSTIELVGAPSEIKLVLPEKPEIELVYKGAPIDVKINLDIGRITGEGADTQCVAIVPCPGK